jgi:hypothetical protein
MCLSPQPIHVYQSQNYISCWIAMNNGLFLYKIWGFYGGDYDECHLLGYNTQVLTSQETHYVSATEPSRLMLCKICHVLGYNTLVRTSQDTHYVNATEPSQLMLSKNWGFHGGDDEEYHLLGCVAVWFLSRPMFRRNLSPPSLRWQELAS